MLGEIKGIDIYLLDQFLKERISKESEILDAGCGSGRNIHWLIKNGYDISAFDQEREPIENLKNSYPRAKFKSGKIENKPFDEKQFDFIICNAVLHFANDHTHFHQMFASLVQCLREDGILFIRMTTSIGLENVLEIKENGRCTLPDQSDRYVLDRKEIKKLGIYHSLKLIEPVKSLKVENLRTMSTIVFQKFR